MTLMRPRQAAGTSGLSHSVVARSAQDAVVASGLAPVFGLMRNVNLAYGLNLLGVMKRLLGNENGIQPSSARRQRTAERPTRLRGPKREPKPHLTPFYALPSRARGDIHRLPPDATNGSPHALIIGWRWQTRKVVGIPDRCEPSANGRGTHASRARWE
jgi:hypothetical protein